MFNSKTEQRINFEIFGKIQALMEVYGKKCMSRTRVFEWHKRFYEGRTEVEDDKRSLRPTISKTTNNNRESEKIVREDRRLSIRLIAERMSIDKETMWQVLHENLHMTKVYAQVVSKLLTSDQNEKRQEISTGSSICSQISVLVIAYSLLLVGNRVSYFARIFAKLCLL